MRLYVRPSNMQTMTLSRALLTVSLSALALAAFADKYPLQKTVQITGPVIDKPFDRGPRFDTSIKKPTEEHENPKIPMKPATSINDLPVGSVQPYNRVQSKITFPGVGPTGWVPPDCDMAVGPNNVVVTVNTSFAVFDKKGKMLGETDLTNFFQGVESGNFLSDPITFYDRTTGRFFVTILNLNTNVDLELIAVSETGDPMGAWKKYAINTATTFGGSLFWMDYPKFGYTKDAIAYVGNMFGFNGGYQGAEIVSLPKAGLLSGTPGKASFFNLSNLPTVELSRVYDPSESTIYGLSATAGNQLTVVAVTNPATSPAVQTTTVTIPNQDPPFGDAVAPQGHYMDGFAYDGRLFHCEWRNGHLVSSHNINNPKTGSIEVRWYDILTRGYPAYAPTLVQSGNIPGDGKDDAFQPSVSMNSKGDIGAVYSESSATLAPETRFTARLPGDQLGTMGKPRVVAKSLGATYGDPGFNRWGDYLGIDVDPVDERTFWCFGMVGDPTTNWTTFIASYNVDAFEQMTTASSVSPLEGRNPSGTVADTFATDALYYTLQSTSVGNTGQVASVISSFVPGTLTGTLVGAHLDYDVAGAAGDSMFVFLHNWTTNAWDFMSAGAIGTADSSGNLQLSLNQFKTYSHPTTGEVRALFRAISPNHVSGSGTPFTFKINMVRLTRDAQ